MKLQELLLNDDYITSALDILEVEYAEYSYMVTIKRIEDVHKVLDVLLPDIGFYIVGYYSNLNYTKSVLTKYRKYSLTIYKNSANSNYNSDNSDYDNRRFSIDNIKN